MISHKIIQHPYCSAQTTILRVNPFAPLPALWSRDVRGLAPLRLQTVYNPQNFVEAPPGHHGVNLVCMMCYFPKNWQLFITL